MSEKEAKQIIITSILVTGLLAIAKNVFEQKGKELALPNMRILVGVLLAGFLLSVLAQFAPELAGPLALLLMVTAIFSSNVVFTKLAKIGA